MKKLIFIATFIILSSCNYAYGQIVEETVTVTKSAAIKCLQTGDKVIALTDEIRVKDKSVSDLKEEINRLKTELAKSAQRASDLEAQQVADRAVIEFLLKNTKTRNKFGLIVF